MLSRCDESFSGQSSFPDNFHELCSIPKLFCLLHCSLETRSRLPTFHHENLDTTDQHSPKRKIISPSDCDKKRDFSIKKNSLRSMMKNVRQFMLLRAAGKGIFRRMLLRWSPMWRRKKKIKFMFANPTREINWFNVPGAGFASIKMTWLRLSIFCFSLACVLFTETLEAFFSSCVGNISSFFTFFNNLSSKMMIYLRHIRVMNINSLLLSSARLSAFFFCFALVEC